MNFRVRKGIGTPVVVAALVVIIVVAAGAYFAFSGGLGQGSTSSTTGAQTTTSTPGGQTSSTAVSTTASSSSATLSTSSSSTSAVSSTTSASSASSSSSTVSTSTTYSTYSCTSTISTGTTTDPTPQYIVLIQQFSSMQFKVAGITNGTQSYNSTLSYVVTSPSGGIYDVNLTTSSGTQSASFLAEVDANNNTVLSVTVSGYAIHGSLAKQEFDSFMGLFGLQQYYGNELGVFTDSAYFHSAGTTSMTFGTTTFPVTTYEANSLPVTVNSCGVSSTLTAYTLEVGTPQGTSLQFITYMHFAGSDNSNNSTYDYTFQLVSMTVG